LFNNKVPSDRKAKQMPLFNIPVDPVACRPDVINLQHFSGGLPLQRGENKEVKILHFAGIQQSVLSMKVRVGHRLCGEFTQRDQARS
jgi:hypothetical protein